MNAFCKTFILKISLVLFLLASCSTDKIERNPYLTNVKFNVQINLNLPSYDLLRFAGGSLRLNQGGINGVLVFNLNGNDYLAWDASCPNHSLMDCSKLDIFGVLAKCSCENYQYSLATGHLLNPDEEVKSSYPMLFYNVRNSNNQLFISN